MSTKKTEISAKSTRMEKQIRYKNMKHVKYLHEFDIWQMNLSYLVYKNNAYRNI